MSDDQEYTNLPTEDGYECQRCGCDHAPRFGPCLACRRADKKEGKRLIEIDWDELEQRAMKLEQLPSSFRITNADAIQQGEAMCAAVNGPFDSPEKALAHLSAEKTERLKKAYGLSAQPPHPPEDVQAFILYMVNQGASMEALGWSPEYQEFKYLWAQRQYETFAAGWEARNADNQ